MKHYIVAAVAVILSPFALFGQQKEIGLTIYNNDLALVKEVRNIDLSDGISRISFQDVAARIDPTSVYFSSLTAPDAVSIVEQNYEYDLVNSTKILQKYLDHEISLDAKEGVRYSGTLLSATGGDLILREADGSIKIVNMQTVENMSFPELPEGLITRPTLVWLLDTDKAGAHKAEVGYLTSGIKWHAEYIGVVNNEETHLELSSWVSIENNSGATYKDAKLKLVAGDVHRAQQTIPFAVQAEMVRKSSAQQFEQKAFFEYHLYTLQRRSTVADDQIKQISLFDPAQVSVRKTYWYDGRKDSRGVQVNLEFQNKKSAGLGIPLPEGKLRVYKRDTDQSLVFIGEDFVDHTPKDERIKIQVGNAFDIIGERVQQSRNQVGKSSWDETWSITLRNHKDSAVQVTVVEHLNTGWEILRSSHEYEKRDAQTIEFPVTIPKDGEVEVEYVVRYNR